MRCDASCSKRASEDVLINIHLPTHDHPPAQHGTAAHPSHHHHRRHSSGRLSTTHPRRIITCRTLLLALATLLILQLIAHELFPVSTPLPSIAEGISSLSNSAARLAHTTTHHLLWDMPPGVGAPPLPPTAIPRVLHLVVTSTTHDPPLCTLIGQGGWQVRHYTEAQATAFVHKEFPEHDALYRSLGPSLGPSWSGQRQALFRLLVLLRLGGVVLEQGIDCRADLVPMLVHHSMVVGWQPQGGGGGQVSAMGMAMMAAAPGHPVLRATMQRLSGGGGGQQYGDSMVQAHFTAAVLEYASNVTDHDKWSMWVLPAAMIDPSNHHGLLMSSMQTAAHDGGQWCRWPFWVVQRMVGWWMCPSLSGKHTLAQQQPPAGLVAIDAHYLRPVSLPWQPPVPMLLPAPGVGVVEDAAAWRLLQHGTWGSGTVHCGEDRCVDTQGQETPAVLGLLLQALDAASQEHAHEENNNSMSEDNQDNHTMSIPTGTPWMLDLGAGLGVASVAAAARGHNVLAVEVHSDAARAALVAMGAQPSLGGRLHVAPDACVVLKQADGQQMCLCSDVRPDTQQQQMPPQGCSGPPQVVPPMITAIRVHLPCTEPAVLPTLLPLLHNTSVVHIELPPTADCPNTEHHTNNTYNMLATLHANKLDMVVHAGPLCEARLAAVDAGSSSTTIHHLWCRVGDLDDLAAVVHAHKKDVETIVLRKTAARAQVVPLRVQQAAAVAPATVLAHPPHHNPQPQQAVGSLQH